MMDNGKRPKRLPPWLHKTGRRLAEWRIDKSYEKSNRSRTEIWGCGQIAPDSICPTGQPVKLGQTGSNQFNQGFDARRRPRLWRAKKVSPCQNNCKYFSVNTLHHNQLLSESARRLVRRSCHSEGGSRCGEGGSRSVTPSHGDFVSFPRKSAFKQPRQAQ
jgi:hypothetical protein